MAAGLLLGAVAATVVTWKQGQQNRTDAEQARQQLYAAWKDGYTVPPPAPEHVAPAIIEAFPPEVSDYIQQFDDAGQAVYGQWARSLLTGGMLAPHVVMELERRRTTRQDVIA